MWGIYLHDIEKIVQEYDDSWQKKLDSLSAEEPALTKIRKFLSRPADPIRSEELSLPDFLFICSLLPPLAKHTVLIKLRKLFNQYGFLDLVENLRPLGLLNEKNLGLLNGFSLPDIKQFLSLLTDLSGQIKITSTLLEFISLLIGSSLQVEKMTSCLFLLAEYRLLSDELLTLLIRRVDDFSFIYKMFLSLAKFQDGKLMSHNNLDLILWGNNSVLLAEVLPVFNGCDFFSTQTLLVLSQHAFYAVQIKSTLQFLRNHDCLDQFIFNKLITGDVSLAYHVEFMACLLKGLDLLNKRYVWYLFSLLDDFYLRMGLAKMAEKNLLNGFVLQKIAVNTHYQRQIISASQNEQGNFNELITRCHAQPLQRSASCDELRFFKPAVAREADVKWQAVRSRRQF